MATRKKLEPRDRECVYLDVKPSTKGFVLFDINTREIFVSHHVRFHEFTFLFMQLSIPTDAPQPHLSLSAPA